MEQDAPVFRFGLFELDPSAGELRKGGARISLQELPLKLLGLLVERPGEIVTRQEIHRRLWAPDIHVDFENSLNAAVSRLREALGDTAASPRFIATVPRRGYRFIAPVEQVGGSGADERPPNRAKAPWLFAASALVVLAAMAIAFQFFDDAPKPRDPAGEKPKLAVLPFENLSNDPEQEYLSDGLTEELIAQLGALSPEELGVIARTSVMAYKETGATIERIGRDLGVQHVLEGAVRREDETVRITVRLIQVETQTPLWTATYDRELTGFFELERDIATNVAEALRLELLSSQTSLSAKARTDNARAYELYLRGRHFLNQRSLEGFERALRIFEQALEEDPDYAAVYLGLADTYALMGAFDIRKPRAVYPAALEMVNKALELDSKSAEAHLTLAYIQFVYEWNWQSGEEELRRSMSLNPNLASGHLLYGGYLSNLGRHDEAIAAVRRARELDPLSLTINAQLGWQLTLARRYDDAIEQYRKTLELDPDFLPAQDNLKWTLILDGREQEACEAFLRVVELEGGSRETAETLRRVSEEEGLEGLLRESLGSPESRSRQPQESPYDIALDYAILGEVSVAIDWLEKAYEQRETDMVGLAVDPRLDSLRTDPRFEVLLHRLGVAQSSQN